MTDNQEPQPLPEGVTFLDSGADSFVYLSGSDVVKVYKKESPEKIRLYQQLTDQVAQLLNNDPTVYQIEIGGKPCSYTISVNPIKYVGEDPRFPGKVTSVSEYIPGPHISGLFPPEVPFDGLTFSNQVNPYLDTLSDQLNNKFGFKGISILEPNVKFKFDPNNETPISLIITDLSSHLWALESA